MNDAAPTDATVRRSYQIYLYAVCFVTVLVLVFASASAVYGLVRIAAPGTTVSGSTFGFSEFGGDERSLRMIEDVERDAGVAQLLQSGIIALAALAAFAWHWRRAQEVRAELERAGSRPPGPGGPPGRPEGTA